MLTIINILCSCCIVSITTYYYIRIARIEIFLLTNQGLRLKVYMEKDTLNGQKIIF